MNCPGCGHKNPATIPYCQKCGGKMDLTADEIRQALVDKARGEVLQATEYYARQSLFFAAVVFLAALTVFFLAGGAPEQSHFVPSSASGARHLEVRYAPNLSLPPLVVPVEPRRRGR